MKKILLCLSGVLITGSVLLSGCKTRITEETDLSGNKIIKEWFGKNRLKSVKTIYKETQNDYLLEIYNKEGKIIDSARYINDTIEGTRKFFEAKTTLLHTENYSHGVLNGIHKAVYSNGVTGFEGFRKNGMMVGEWKFHFFNGHPITYEYYDSSGVMKYFRKYDDEGNVLRVDGIGMINIQTEQSRLDTSGILSGIVEAAVPPGCTAHFTIQDDKTSQAGKKYLEVILDKPKFKWEIQLTEPGEVKLKYIIAIIDNISGNKEESASEQTLFINPEKK